MSPTLCTALDRDDASPCGNPLRMLPYRAGKDFCVNGCATGKGRIPFPTCCLVAGKVKGSRGCPLELPMNACGIVC